MAKNTILCERGIRKIKHVHEELKFLDQSSHLRYIYFYLKSWSCLSCYFDLMYCRLFVQQLEINLNDWGKKTYMGTSLVHPWWSRMSSLLECSKTTFYLGIKSKYDHIQTHRKISTPHYSNLFKNWHTLSQNKISINHVGFNNYIKKHIILYMCYKLKCKY